jgi:hypothetical protein
MAAKKKSKKTASKKGISATALQHEFGISAAAAKRIAAGVKNPKSIKPRMISAADAKKLDAAIAKATRSVKKFSELGKFRPVSGAHTPKGAHFRTSGLHPKTIPGISSTMSKDVMTCLNSPRVPDEAKAAIIEGVQEVIAASSNEYRGYPAPVLKRHIILLADKIERAIDAGVNLDVAPYIAKRDTPEVIDLLKRGTPEVIDLLKRG